MKAKDITGQDFGRLVAVKKLRKNKHGGWIWLCDCKCGNTKEATQNHLSQGNTTSCGCWAKEVTASITKRPSKETLEIYYNNYSIEECCEHFGVKFQTIYKWLDLYDIKNKLEDLYSTTNLSQKQKEMIIGSLLGDGCMTTPIKNHYNSLFQENHCVAQKGYVQWKYDELGVFQGNFTQTFKKRIRNGVEKTSEQWMLRTLCHPEFTQLEKQWYARDVNGERLYNAKGEKVKLIPNNLTLTPLIVAVWYCDDGFNQPKYKYSGLCTNCFTFEEVYYLVELLKNLGINNCKVTGEGTQENKPQIKICRSSYLDFINMVKDHIPVSCIQYKFATDHQAYMALRA